MAARVSPVVLGGSCRPGRVWSQARGIALFSRGLVGEADGGGAEAVEGFASPGGDVGVGSFVGLGDSIEKRPRCARPEFPVGGFTPFMQDLGDLGGGDGATIGKTSVVMPRSLTTPWPCLESCFIYRV
jgi:hypothetical protein